MKLTKPIFGMLALTLLLGCVRAALVNREQIRTMRDKSMMRSMGLTIHYCGSMKGFDYFRGWNPDAGSIGREEWYRVSETEKSVSDRFPFTTKRELWRPYAD